MKFFNNFLERNSIIDIVVPPNVSLVEIVKEIKSNFDICVLLDTKGNLVEEFLISGLPTDGQPVGIISCLVLTFDYFIKQLENLKNLKNFVLIIDSITFVCDISPNSIKLVNSLFWNLIYQCDATVISINHYRKGHDKSVFNYIPRMGNFWASTISYQILVKQIDFKLQYNVKKIDVYEY